MLAPPPLLAGDLIHVVAPSSPFDRTLFWRGLGVLARHFRLKYSSGIFQRDWFLAGSDARRCSELKAALSDPLARAVVAVRGGYGAMRLLDDLSPAEVLKHPKWLVGFSDITALHLLYARFGLMSLHACNLTGLGRGDAAAHQQFLAALLAPLRPRTLAGKTEYPGSAEGPLVGGNLTMIAALASSGRLRIPVGSILALEDVGESPYALDRMLQALAMGGHLDHIGGIVVGELVGCDRRADGIPPLEVVIAQLRRLRVPTLSGLPFGHGRQNAPLTFGARARINAPESSLTVAADGSRRA